MIRFIGYYRRHNPGLTPAGVQRIESLADVLFVDETPDPSADRAGLREALQLARDSATRENLLPVIAVTGLADLGRSLAHLVFNVTAILDLHGAILILGDDTEALWAAEDDTRGALADILPAPLTSRQLARRLDQARAAMASEHVKRGQHQAREAGAVVGRPRALTDQQETEVLHRLEQGEDPRQIAHDFGVSRNTLFRAAERARTPHVTGENTSRGKGTSSEPPEDANQLRRTSI